MGLAGAIIGGVSVVAGAATSIISGNKAAGAAKDAAAQSNETERYIYDTTRADYAPYRDVGYSALGKLATQTGVPTADNPAGGRDTTYDGFETSPGYQFRVNEGMKAIERSAAARGSLRSGGTMKSIGRYVSDYAAGPEYAAFTARQDSAANRLAALAGVGQSATGSTAQAGANYASGTSANNTAAGNAAAGAYANTGNAINGGITNLASAYLYSKAYAGGGNFGRVGGVINNYGNA